MYVLWGKICIEGSRRGIKYIAFRISSHYLDLSILCDLKYDIKICRDLIKSPKVCALIINFTYFINKKYIFLYIFHEVAIYQVTQKYAHLSLIFYLFYIFLISFKVNISWCGPPVDTLQGTQKYAHLSLIFYLFYIFLYIFHEVAIYQVTQKYAHLSLIFYLFYIFLISFKVNYK